MDEIAAMAVRLAGMAGVPLLERLALLLALAVVVVVWGKVAEWKVSIPGDPESQKPLPDAQWGDNVKPDDGPPGGGMEGG